MSETTRFRRMHLGPLDVLVVAPEKLMQGVRKRFPFRRGSPQAPAGAHPGSPAAPPREAATEGSEALAAAVAALEWYHTIELPGGVVTPGLFDLRPFLGHYPIPERLDGMRVLDVATFDGFWAFEMEKRGAAEVVCIDIGSFEELDLAPSVRRRMSAEDLRPTGAGFRLCHEALGSRVQRELCNVYDLSPERLGTFDFVFLSDLLLHLNNPVRALQRVCSVTGGEAVIVDVYNPVLPGHLISYEGGSVECTWWSFGLEALTRMVEDAGFDEVERVGEFPTGYRDGESWIWHAAFVARNHGEGAPKR